MTEREKIPRPDNTEATFPVVQLIVTIQMMVSWHLQSVIFHWGICVNIARTT